MSIYRTNRKNKPYGFRWREGGKHYSRSFKTKAEAEKVLISKGYIVKSSLTREVTILVNESGLESSKTKKARDSGVSITTNLNQLLGN